MIVWNAGMEYILSTEMFHCQLFEASKIKFHDQCNNFQLKVYILVLCMF